MILVKDGEHTPFPRYTISTEKRNLKKISNLTGDRRTFAGKFNMDARDKYSFAESHNLYSDTDAVAA